MVDRESLGCSFNRIRRRVRLRHPALGQVREVRVLDACNGSTCRIQQSARDRVFGKPERHHGGAPLRWVTTEGDRLGSKAGRIELELHEGVSRPAGEARRDVAVAVRCAGAHLLGIRLGIAERHAEPECRVQLKVEGVRRHRRRIFGQGHPVLHPVARTWLIRVEEQRRLVMTNVMSFSENFLRVLDFGTQGFLGRTVKVPVPGASETRLSRNRERGKHRRKRADRDL